MAWNPDQYDLYRRQRRRPAEDLLAATLTAMGDRAPVRVVDLGCGGGFLAARLAEHWPAATVVGVDSSPAMLDQARETGARVEWLEADIGAWEPAAPVDLILSNAALHWIGDHGRLFPRLMASLVPGGLLAVQMPRNFEAPSHALLAETIRSGPWAGRLADRLGPPPVHDPERYLDWLAPVTADLDLWETVYLHRLVGDNPVLEWTRGTALVPVLERLDTGEAETFLADYARRLRAAYPPRADGATLFPFRRLFLIARAP